MNILFVVRFLPHPKVRDSGGQDTYHYIETLASYGHKISLIAFVSPSETHGISPMQDLCENVVVIPYAASVLGSRIWRAVWRLVLTKVYGRVFSLRYLRALRKLIRDQQYDVAIFEGMMAIYGKLVQVDVKLLDEVDIYANVAYQIMSSTSGLPSRWCARLDWIRTLIAEIDFLTQTYDGVLVRSHKDNLILQEYLPRGNSFVLPPWFEGLDSLGDIPLTRPEQPTLLFVGAMGHPSNVEAVMFFAEEVMPLITDRVPDVEFCVVGANPTSQIQRLDAQPKIEIVGEVDDLKPYYEHCCVNVVPLLRGGGIIVKTLNGMASGRPTVATTWGASGIAGKSGRDLVIVDRDPVVFAEAVIALLTDTDLWYRIARGGREIVRKSYDWDLAMLGFNDFLTSLT
jgi:glycosyltransferase involved in cell wall biosynthesis